MAGSDAIRFPGFDSSGETFSLGGRILRGIYEQRAQVTRDVLGVIEREDLFEQGIVRTAVVDDPDPSEHGFALMLEHERVPFISYPHEWAAPALRDAAIFHTELFSRLLRFGLVLKDWHPNNILFDGPWPVMVDFTSIVPTDLLASEPYLARAAATGFARFCDPSAVPIFDMFKTMFMPFFLWPLEMMRRGEHARARTRMFETALNRGGGWISKGEALPATSPRRWVRDARSGRFYAALCRRGPEAFFELLSGDLRRYETAAPASDYSEYYRAKGQDFGFQPSREWTPKNHGVYELLTARRPRTVLDIGSNTGWFSVLAAKQGCDVVALDVDETSVALLYDSARRDDLSILPLVMDVTEEPTDVAAVEDDAEKPDPRVVRVGPLLSRPSARLRSEIVLALGLLHHLVLGSGRTFRDIVDLLDRWVVDTLVLEFVDKDDPLIQKEPEFFPAFNSDPRSFEWYDLDRLRHELARSYRSVAALPSDGPTRTLLVCKR